MIIHVTNSEVIIKLQRLKLMFHCSAF